MNILRQVKSLLFSGLVARAATGVYTTLLLIITFRLTCGKMKICSNIKKSQNTMNMTVPSSYCIVNKT